jgi:hypothetical protein
MAITEIDLLPRFCANPPVRAQALIAAGLHEFSPAMAPVSLVRGGFGADNIEQL